MEAYRRWVQRNKEYVHSLESLANGLTWLLPERFSESEIGPEAVTSLLGIITTINNHILETPPTRARTGLAESSSFPLSLCITLLKDMETLVEVVAQQYYGEEKKWNFMALTESIKALLRLAVLRKNGYKMLLHGGESSNDGCELDSRINGLPSGPGPQTPWNLEGRALSALSRFGENARSVSEPTWLRRVHHQQEILEPPTLVKEKPNLSTFLSAKGISGGLFLTGEVMFILRPLVYVLLIRRYGARSWLPWLTSLLVDLIGHGIISTVTVSSRLSKDFKLSTIEKNELKRRKFLWALYLMRDPFFTKYTRQRLDRTEKLLEPIPIIGLLTEKLVELLVGAQTRYTYMSGS
ncbi:shrunken seed 1 family protein [Striga asiatica]|uniref:Peroxisomal membrane protein PEX16 n=1 Tax=Striga asiatica TaxID=4170 RepID=A0A5A7PEY3_STRAF|nr:shrunken seed 1 family protein [Striga asiatica]